VPILRQLISARKDKAPLIGTADESPPKTGSASHAKNQLDNCICMTYNDFWDGVWRIIMTVFKKVVKFLPLSAAVGFTWLLLAVFTVSCTAGCSSRREHKSRSFTITTRSLPEGAVGVAYPATTLTATGGTTPYTWSDVNNTLQTYGLSLDSSTGRITGTPIQATPSGGVTVTIRVTDANGKTAQKDFTLVIYPELQITTTSLPDAAEGIAYTYAIAASGGNPANYTWSINGQPSWLAIDSSTGELRGTPPVGSAGNIFTFTVKVDDGQQTASKQFDLRVNSAPIPPVANFEASPSQGKVSLTVTFTDKSTGTITQWQWDFDNDGTVDSTDQNPQWTYNSPGWYTVKLTVSNGVSSDTCVKERYILVYNNVYYVDGVNGDDTKSGTDWSSAWKTIGKALSVAGDYDMVLVADATYNEITLKFSGKKIYLKGVDHNNAGHRPVIDCQKSGRAFYFDSGETKDSIIDNFEIEHGKDDNGGAIYIDANSSPTIINCTFNRNSATSHGGAIYCANSSPTVTNCEFTANTASYYGGAIYCESSNPTITDCTFSRNTADWDGGAILCFASGPTISDCTFTDNNAKGSGGAICCTDNTPTLTNCAFNNNSAGDDGGAIACYSSSPTLTGCSFSGNSTTNDGGAISCDDSSAPTMTNCVFSGNNTGKNGGAVACYSSTPTLTNCTFTGNSANGSGGAIQCESNSNATLNNCILWADTATNDGNEICVSDTGSFCTLNYCCVDNAGYGGQTGNITENSCVYDDPQFFDPANGDYHLKEASPCIDAGDNSLVPGGVDKDLDGNQRIVDGDNNGTAVVDIGAYEYQLRITTTTLPIAYEDVSYSYTVTASGGNSANYAWSISGHPSWLTINATTGELSGTPPVGSAGTYTFTVEVTDGQQTVSRRFDLTVKRPDPLVITTTWLPNGYENVTYSGYLRASGGVPPHTWSVTSGDLNAIGLSLDQSTGKITGTPPAGSAGVYSFTFRVEDLRGTSATVSLDIQISTTPVSVDFIADKLCGTAPLTVNFTEMVATLKSVSAWEWDFDNNGTTDATGPSASYTYNNPGVYSVKLTITINGQPVSCVKENYIRVFSANTLTWTGGAGNGDWSDAANWNPNQIPDKDTDVVIPDGSCTVQLSADGECRSIEIGSGVTLNTQGHNLTVHGDFRCKGDIELGNAELILAGSGLLYSDSPIGNIRVSGHYAAASNLNIGGNISIEQDASFEGRHYVIALGGDFINNGTFTHQAPGLPNADAESEGGWWFCNYKEGNCPNSNIEYSETYTNNPHGGNNCVRFKGDGSYLWGVWFVGRVVSIPSYASSANLKLWSRYWNDTWGGGNVYVYDGDWGEGSPNPQLIANLPRASSGSWTQLTCDLTPYIGRTIWIGYVGTVCSLGHWEWYIPYHDHGKEWATDDWEIEVDGNVNGQGLISHGVLHFNGLTHQEIKGTPQYEQFGVLWVGGKSLGGQDNYEQTELVVPAGRVIRAAFVEVFGKLVLSDNAVLELGGEAYGGILRIAELCGILVTNSAAGSEPVIRAVNTCKDSHRFAFTLLYSGQLDVNGLVLSGSDENGLYFLSSTETNYGTRNLNIANVQFMNTQAGGVHLRYRGREDLTFDGCFFDDSFGATGHNVWTCGDGSVGNSLTFTNWSGPGGGEAYEWEDTNAGEINW